MTIIVRKTAFAVAIFGSLLGSLGVGPLSAQSFTLPQVMSGGFSSELKASPQGSRLAWIENHQGKRNLWVTEVSGDHATALQVTAYDKDDGQNLGDVAWTPDGRNVIYARGGDFEFPDRAFPNPALLPEGVDQVIWMVSADGKQTRKLAEGRSPTVSPDGKLVAFLSKGQLWTLALNDASAKPVVLFHARGDISPALWSPDSKSVAFVSKRGDHGFVGVYNLTAQTITYMDPSTTSDDAPVWSPDSKSLAYVRVPPSTSTIFKPKRTAEPWSIHIADAATGTGRQLWLAAKGPGSAFHALATDQQLFWTAGNQIIFPWESDGWEHLYAIPVAGGKVTPLTPGAFEVEHASISEDGAKIVFSSNQDDIDRRHIWEINTKTGNPTVKQLSHGESIEVFPVITSGGVVAALHSTARKPIHPALLADNGSAHDVAPQLVPAEFPADKLVVPQQVMVTAADGMQIHGQLFLPPGGANQRHPAVVFFHGGSRREMLLGWHYMDYYANAYAMNQYLASQGYVVLSVNYRSGIGYGLDFREALNYGAAGASEYNDVMGAGLYLKNRPDVDPAHIGAWGGSYGGFLTAMALSRSSDLFAAGVDMHGVHDWNDTIRNFQASYNPADDPNAARLAWESSPLSSVKNWRSPVLLIQGDDDRNVRFSNTVRLAAALREQGVEFEEHVFPDEIHGFLMYRSWLTAYTLSADFLNRHLKSTTGH